MITAQNAFDWLNWEEGVSHLSESSNFSIWQIRDAKVIEAERNSIIDSMVFNSRDMSDLCERAEVLGNCAIANFVAGQREESSRLMQQANNIYRNEKDHHRQAVAEWCLFQIRRSLLENGVAFAHARLARGLFNDQAARYVLMGDKDARRTRWYRDRAAEMTRDLVATVEEGYEWINQFTPSRMSGSALQLREKIRSDLQEKSFGDVYHNVGLLRKITEKAPHSLETAEALAFCGLAMSQMGNRDEAIRYLRMAQSNAVPDSHEHTAMRWMVGLVQFDQPGERSRAVNNLETSLGCFDALRIKANQKNQPDVFAWYETHVDAMRKALKDLLLKPVS